MQASIIIPTYNKAPRLRLTLAALETQTAPKNAFEVIVVDDGSTDETEATLGRLGKNLPLVYIRQTNQGRSRARNRGVELARYPLLLFLDDDCPPSPNYVTENIRQFTPEIMGHNRIYNLPFVKFFRNPSDGEYLPELERTAGVAMGMKKALVTLSDVTEGFWQMKGKKLTHLERTILDLLQRPPHSPARSYEWLGCVGGSMAVSREAFERVGGFDPEMGREWGCEDLEFGFRLHRAGYQVQLIKDTAVYHLAHYRGDTDPLLEKALRYTYNKHGYEELRLLWEEFFRSRADFDRFLARVLTEKNKSGLGGDVRCFYT